MLLDIQFDGEPVHIIAHSYGCLIASVIAEKYKNVETLITLSSPWNGSRTAKWLNMVFRESKLFATTKPGSPLLKAIASLKLDFPITNIVSTGTKSSANALAGLGSTPNDGLLTLETQRAVPQGFTNCETIDMEVSHNELLMSMEVVELIKEKIFNGTADNP
jgi:pimeloyl-ACP methyl ester carboxylesterase